MQYHLELSVTYLCYLYLIVLETILVDKWFKQCSQLLLQFLILVDNVIQIVVECRDCSTNPIYMESIISNKFCLKLISIPSMDKLDHHTEEAWESEKSRRWREQLRKVVGFLFIILSPRHKKMNKKFINKNSCNGSVRHIQFVSDISKLNYSFS